MEKLLRLPCYQAQKKKRKAEKITSSCISSDVMVEFKAARMLVNKVMSLNKDASLEDMLRLVKESPKCNADNVPEKSNVAINTGTPVCNGDTQSSVPRRERISYGVKKKKSVRRMTKEEYLRCIKKLPDYKYILKVLNLRKQHKTKLNQQFTYITNNYTFWNTYSYLKKQAHRCILLNDWDNLTKLLIKFCGGSKHFYRDVKKAVLINCLNNPVARENGFVDVIMRNAFSCQNEKDREEVLKKYLRGIVEETDGNRRGDLGVDS